MAQLSPFALNLYSSGLAGTEGGFGGMGGGRVRDSSSSLAAAEVVFFFFF